jgi:P-type E1-E2 ATPase
VLIDNVFAAVIHFEDLPRLESRGFVDHLAPYHGITKVMIMSGDRDAEVQHLGKLVGIADVQGGLSPEEKLHRVIAETKRAPTLYVGDGINDAPALQAATVGVALGTKSDITSEASDAVILDQSLESVDDLIHIARRMRRIALQSAIGGMGLSVLGMGAASIGLLTPLAGAITQECIDVLAVLNALRTASADKSDRDSFS